EANHVWLIFVIVVAWTAYPTVLASIASTLSIPLFVAAVGIILRGTAYALRAQAESGLVATRTERLLGVSSILTPFALGATAGGATLLLVRAGRYEAARLAAATAVAAVVAGWAVAQSPDLLPGVTVDDAAAGHATLVAIVISVAGGALILFPSLALLFNLTLAGRFDPGRAVVAAHTPEPRL